MNLYLFTKEELSDFIKQKNKLEDRLNEVLHALDQIRNTNLYEMYIIVDYFIDEEKVELILEASSGLIDWTVFPTNYLYEQNWRERESLSFNSKK